MNAGGRLERAPVTRDRPQRSLRHLEHPTQGEVFKRAGDAYNKTRLTPRAARFFETWFKVFK